MSEFGVPVVKIGKIGKHPNADRLELTQVEGVTCVVQAGQWKTGDKAVYVPVDAMVPRTDQFSWLFTEGDDKERKRVCAARIRGIFSMGLLVPAPDGFDVGQDAAAALDILKYEAPTPAFMGGKVDTFRNGNFIPVYGVENYFKYRDVIQAGEMVIVTEKIHGTNSRFIFDNDGLHCGSHLVWWAKDADTKNVWWQVAEQYDLESKLMQIPNIVIYGETYGDGIQDLKYDLKGKYEFAVFDAFDTMGGRFLTFDELRSVCEGIGLPMIPSLYYGPFDPAKIEPMKDGASTLAKHIREGIVIKSLENRFDERLGRVILKAKSEAYLLRKNGTEFH